MFSIVVHVSFSRRNIGNRGNSLTKCPIWFGDRKGLIVKIFSGMKTLCGANVGQLKKAETPVNTEVSKKISRGDRI